MEYLRRRKEIRRIPEYFYCPEPLSESLPKETEDDVIEKRHDIMDTDVYLDMIDS